MTYTYAPASPAELRTMAGARVLHIADITKDIPASDRKARVESPLMDESYGYVAGLAARTAITLCEEYLPRVSRAVALDVLAAVGKALSFKGKREHLPAELLADAIADADAMAIRSLFDAARDAKAADEAESAARKAERDAQALADAATDAADAATPAPTPAPAPAPVESAPVESARVETVTVAVESDYYAEWVSIMVAAFEAGRDLPVTPEDYAMFRDLLLALHVVEPSNA